MTMDSETDGARYVLEFEKTLFLSTFLRYVQKTTSPICLNFQTVAMLSKFVRLDSEICFEFTSIEEIKCLGFCGTRKQISFWNVSRVVVMRPLPQNSDFMCAPVLSGLLQDVTVSQDVSQRKGKVREPISPLNYTISTSTSSRFPLRSQERPSLSLRMRLKRTN